MLDIVPGGYSTRSIFTYREPYDDAAAVSGWLWADLPPVPVVGQLMMQLAVNDVPGQRLWGGAELSPSRTRTEQNRTPPPAALAISVSCSSAKKNLVPSV